MHRRLLLLCAVLFSAWSVGCATQLATPEVSEHAFLREQQKQRELIVATRWKRQKRLLDVGAPILVAGTDQCGEDVGPVWGVAFGRVDDFPAEFRSAARRVFSSAPQPTVWHVVHGLPAHLAGLRAGDILAKVNGNVPSSTKQTMRLFEQAGDVVPLEIVRQGRRYRASVRPVRGCSYSLELAEGVEANAFADGNRVMITNGMMRFAETDDELALVIGHEIAHNALGHLDRRKANQIAGMVLGGLLDVAAAAAGVDTKGAGIQAGSQAGARAFSQDFEKEADYMGVYLAARAGRDVADAANFWRRMAIEYPASVQQSYTSSHPSTPERSVGIERTVGEIGRKRARGLALVPRRKDLPAAQAP